MTLAVGVQLAFKPGRVQRVHVLAPAQHRESSRTHTLMLFAANPSRAERELAPRGARLHLSCLLATVTAASATRVQTLRPSWPLRPAPPVRPLAPANAKPRLGLLGKGLASQDVRGRVPGATITRWPAAGLDSKSEYRDGPLG